MLSVLNLIILQVALFDELLGPPSSSQFIKLKKTGPWVTMGTEHREHNLIRDYVKTSLRTSCANGSAVFQRYN